MADTPPAAGLAARLARLSPRQRFAATVLAGLFLATGQAPLHLWPLALLGLWGGGLAYLATSDPRAAARAGFALGLGYFAGTLHWIVEPFLVNLALHGWMAPFALIFMAAGIALFWAGAFALARWLGGGALALALGWTVAELARAYLFTGFPWAMLGYLWGGTPAVQLLAWIGPYGLTFVSGLLAAGPIVLANNRGRRAGLTVAALSVVALMTAGALRTPAPDASADAPVVRLVQPNAPQDEKWEPDLMAGFFYRQLDYTIPAPRPDLVVWPETAIPWLLDYSGELVDLVGEAAAGVPVVFGIQRSENFERFFNSLILLDGTGTISDIYDKHHLVPFGEYLPLAFILDALGFETFAGQQVTGYTPGPGPRTLEIPGVGAMLPLICYEAVFPRDARGTEARPRLLLQITNDAWFGKVSGPFQHLDQARFRAIEQGLPMARVANTGVSAMIDADGRVTHRIALGEAGYVDAPLPPMRAPTLYARTGDLPILLLLAAVFAALVVRRRRIGH